MKALLLFALLLGTASSASASALRIDISKNNAGKDFVVKKSEIHGLIVFDFSIKDTLGPGSTVPVWRVDYWHMDKKKVVASVHVRTELKNGRLSGSVSLIRGMVPNVKLVVRAGKHAPMAETMYFIDLKSFL